MAIDRNIVNRHWHLRVDRHHFSDEPRLWKFWIALAAVIMAGVVVFASSVWTLWFALDQPKVSTGQPLQPADQLDLVRIALIVTGGLGGFVALVVAYRRQRIAEDANWRETLASRQENYKLFNELFTTISELLGHSSAAVRLAGVYAMAELADGWPRYRQVCISVLCAYLRTPYVTDPSPEESGAEHEVRASIVQLVRDHLREDAPISWRNNQLELARAKLGDLDLEIAIADEKSKTSGPGIDAVQPADANQTGNRMH
jgi:hypothetical protein